MIARRSTATARHAFTLMEVLLAVAVAAIILLAINGVFFGALRLRNRATEAIERALPLERALAFLQRDLANLVPPGGTLSGNLQTLGSTNALVPDQVGPEFYTASATLDDVLPWAEVQKVAYLLVTPTNRTDTGLDLFRATTRNLLPPLYEEPVREWLLSGVERLEFQFHDGTQWVDDWDSTVDSPPLPRAIKVELQLAAKDPRDEPPLPIELVVPLLVDGGTNDTSSSTSSQGSL